MSAAIRCPSCGHVLVTLGLPAPVGPPVQARPPSEPLLLRVSEAGTLLGVSRSTMYGLIASGAVPISCPSRWRSSVRGDGGQLSAQEEVPLSLDTGLWFGGEWTVAGNTK